MYPHLELLAAFFMNVGTLDNGVDRLFCRQGNRPGDSCSGPKRGVNNLFGRLVDNFVVVGFEANLDFLGSVGGHGWFLSFVIFSFFDLNRQYNTGVISCAA